MRLALIGSATAVVALLAATSSSDAQFSRRYCTFGGGPGSSGEPDCSYDTFEQCRASASGLGRYCGENPHYVQPLRSGGQREPKQGKGQRPRD